ncbi:MAG: TIGR03905 family TSCPD domain-containing protein [Oscillospiraceae bacterium]|nr:TIGR03905 family TSCPD domain-containing protein [Oscillospiraceae bacterium]
MEYIFKPRGVCSNLITIELDGEKIKKVEFMGGCSGNSRGISQLVKGCNAKDVIKRLRGVRCGTGKTSCPDQLSFALEQALEQEK